MYYEMKARELLADAVVEFCGPDKERPDFNDGDFHVVNASIALRAITKALTPTEPDADLVERVAKKLRAVFYELGAIDPDNSSGQADLERLARAALSAIPSQGWEPIATLQARVQPWMMECFGAETSGDVTERCDRFIEEAFELVQALDYDPNRIRQLIEYTYGRPAGEPKQEVGGVMVTLSALCLATGMDMHEAGETELARIWTKIDKIRAKQAAKPAGIALPMISPQDEVK